MVRLAAPQAQVLESEDADLQKESRCIRNGRSAAPTSTAVLEIEHGCHHFIRHIHLLAGYLAACLPAASLVKQVQVLESEVADLEKELALRSEMEAALKDTLRELERKAARQDTGGRQVRKQRVHCGCERLCMQVCGDVECAYCCYYENGEV
jgi:hypothetical protein